METRVKVQPFAYHRFSPCNKSTMVTMRSVLHSLSVLQEGASFSSIFEYSTPKDSCQVCFGLLLQVNGEKAVIGFQNEQLKIRLICPGLVTADIGMMWKPLKSLTSGQSQLIVEPVAENPEVDLV